MIITVVLNYKSVVTAATTLRSLRHFPFPNGAYRSHCAVCDFLQHGTFSDVMQIPLAVYHLLVSVLVIQRRKLARYHKWQPVDVFLLRGKGVARHFFSQQLISALAEGGCDTPNGCEGLTASQECVCVWSCVWVREREHSFSWLYFYAANHSKQTKEYINCSWTTLRTLEPVLYRSCKANMTNAECF